jgi:uncharacterized membrane protein
VPVLENVPVIRIIIGITLVFFAPGFTWTFVLFKQINHLERLVLSFALSLAIVTLSLLGLNAVMHIRITGLNAVLTILLLTIIPPVMYLMRRYIKKRKWRQKEKG